MQFVGRRVGGVNAFSVFHDVWMQHWRITGGFFVTSTIPSAVYFQYEALGVGAQTHILSSAGDQ